MTKKRKGQQQVLIVGRDRLITSNLARLFRHQGARVIIARSRVRATVCLQENDIDLMLYDIFMGANDEGALINWACRILPKLSIVAISGAKPFQQGMAMMAVARELRDNTIVRGSLDPELSHLLFNSFPCFSGPALNISTTHFDGPRVTGERAAPSYHAAGIQ